MLRLFVKMAIRDSDFRKSAAYYIVAAIFKKIGSFFTTGRETCVRIIDPVLNKTKFWRWRNPWLKLLSALVVLLIAALMVPLESINLLGSLLEKADEKLRAAGNRYIDRWMTRYKNDTVVNSLGQVGRLF